MDTNLQLLKQFYEEVGVTPTVENIEQRLVLQKVALLGQMSGVSLDYRYNWYVKGPYSPGLTEDYFKLQGHLKDGDAFNFNQEIKEKLASLKELIFRNGDGNQVTPRWVEALASLAFLITKSHESEEAAMNLLESQKPHITPQMRNDALAALKEYNFI